MSQQTYFKIMGGLFSLTALLALSNVGLIVVAVTMGLAFPLVVAVPSAGIYGLALLPGVVFGRFWSWGVSAVLVGCIAIVPSVIAQGIGSAKRAERVEDRIAAVPLQRDVSVVDVSVRGALECEALCKALLAGGQVQAVRLLKGDGTESAVFTPGPEGPWFGRTDIAKGDLRVEVRYVNKHKIAKTWTPFEQFFVEPLGEDQWVIVDSISDKLVFQRTELSYALSRVPTSFAPVINGLTTGGNQGGIETLKTADRIHHSNYAMLSEALMGLGVKLGDPEAIAVDPGIELTRLRRSIESGLATQDKLNRQFLGLIWEWGEALNANGPAGAEDVALYGKLLAREDTTNPYIMATALVWNGPVRRSYLADVLAGFAEADEKQRAGFYTQVFRALAMMRLSELEADIYRDQLKTIMTMTEGGKPNLADLHLIFAGAAVGEDALSALAQFEFEAIGKLHKRDALQIVHMGLCIGSVEERRTLGPVVVRWLVGEAEKGQLPWNGPWLDLLRVLFVSGFTSEVEGLIAMMDAPPTAEYLERLTQEGSAQGGVCDRFHQRVVSID